MRLPIILMLLSLLLLPADLQGLAADVRSGVQAVTTSVGKLLQRHDEVQVAEAAPATRVVKASVSR